MKIKWKPFLFLIFLLVDRGLGILIGQKCDLCREWTMRNCDGLRWCDVCLVSELERHGL